MLLQVFVVVPQLAGDLQALKGQVTENMQSVCEACVSNARQLDGTPRAEHVAESLVGERADIWGPHRNSPRYLFLRGRCFGARHLRPFVIRAGMHADLLYTTPCIIHFASHLPVCQWRRTP